MAEDIEQIIDKLKRAYEMEESMSNKLVQLCQMPEILPGVKPTSQREIQQILLKIQADTSQHKQTIMDILNRLY